MNELNDYGSYNKVYIISNNILEVYINLYNPHMYIKEIILSEDSSKVLFFITSKKSDYLFFVDNNDMLFSPELVETTKIKFFKQKGIEYFQRVDYENYTKIKDIDWSNNNIIMLNLEIFYENEILLCSSEYNISGKSISIN